MADYYLKRIPDGLYLRLKASAALDGISVKEAVIRAFTAYLRDRERTAEDEIEREIARAEDKETLKGYMGQQREWEEK